MARETNIVHKHTVSALRNAVGYSTHLPGGVWRNVAPNHVGDKRHLVIAHTDGTDVPAFSGGFVGSGMQYLFKVLDRSESEENAVAAYNWVEDTLLANNGANLVGAYVWFDRERPFTLPVVTNDVIWQQEGRFLTVFVDLI